MKGQNVGANTDFIRRNSVNKKHRKCDISLPNINQRWLNRFYLGGGGGKFSAKLGIVVFS